MRRRTEARSRTSCPRSVLVWCVRFRVVKPPSEGQPLGIGLPPLGEAPSLAARASAPQVSVRRREARDPCRHTSSNAADFAAVRECSPVSRSAHRHARQQMTGRLYRRSKPRRCAHRCFERVPVAVGRRPSDGLSLGEPASAHPQDASTERDRDDHRRRRERGHSLVPHPWSRVMCPFFAVGLFVVAVGVP